MLLVHVQTCFWVILNELNDWIVSQDAVNCIKFSGDNPGWIWIRTAMGPSGALMFSSSMSLNFTGSTPSPIVTRISTFLSHCCHLSCCWNLSRMVFAITICLIVWLKIDNVVLSLAKSISQMTFCGKQSLSFSGFAPQLWPNYIIVIEWNYNSITRVTYH